MWKIQLFKLNFDEKELAAAEEVVASGWLTMGEKTAAFETAFGKFLGCDAGSVAVSSGTAALHMALLALDIGPGDDVIIPALTFVADANVVKLVGADPVLADCASINDWNVSAKTIAQCITSRTKAVIVVHYAGYPCDMPSIMELCRQRGIKVIEDVAHAPGATMGGQQCGTFGDVGCFSFFSNKNLSIGEGGMAVSVDSNVHQRLKYLRSHGMTTLTLDRHEGRAVTYDVVAPGLNYRIDEIRAAIGLVQLDKLHAGNQRRKILTDRYRERLSALNIRIPFERMAESADSAYHILPILLPEACDRQSVIISLKERGVQSSIHYPPFWTFSAYAEMFKADDAPIAAEICKRELTLPLYPTMTESEVDYVADSLGMALT